jgi:hypothetical protein
VLAFFIPGEVVVSGFGILVVAVIWLARSLWKLGERLARLEGKINGRSD